jgi:hypothetical protein
MNKKEIQEKMKSYLDLNYNMSLYSQRNRRFLADQLSSIAVGKDAVNTASSTYNGSGEKLEGGDEFGLGGGNPINYTREDQRKVDEIEIQGRLKEQEKIKSDPKKDTKKSESTDEVPTTKKNVSKKRLKRFSKSKV